MRTPIPPPTRRRHKPWAPAAWLAALACAGCGGGQQEIARYEEFEIVQVREELVELPLGHFSVPVPVTQNKNGELVRTNLMQISFQLLVLVAPDSQKPAEKTVERRSGELRDRVIGVCRNASVDDLTDPLLSTLKLRIFDAIQPMFQEVVLRKVLITNILPEPL